MSSVRRASGMPATGVRTILGLAAIVCALGLAPDASAEAGAEPAAGPGGPSPAAEAAPPPAKEAIAACEAELSGERFETVFLAEIEALDEQGPSVFINDADRAFFRKRLEEGARRTRAQCGRVENPAGHAERAHEGLRKLATLLVGSGFITPAGIKVSQATWHGLQICPPGFFPVCPGRR